MLRRLHPRNGPISRRVRGRVQATIDTLGYRVTVVNASGTFTYDIDNRLESDGLWDYTYSDDGNLLKKVHVSTGVAWKYGYDHWNHLVSAKKYSEDPDFFGTAVLQMEALYKYDVLGNRIEKSVDADGAGGGSAEVSRFAYDGWNPAKPSPIGLENFDVWAEFTVGGSLTTRYLRDDRVDGLYARIDVGIGSDTYWNLDDHLGSVRKLLDDAGAVKNIYTYDAFGNRTIVQSQVADGRHFYTSREWDEETGFSFHRDRYYDPAIARWITQDPIQFNAGDVNLYRYVGNNATNATDPSGRFLVCIPLWVIAYETYQTGANPLTLAGAAAEGLVVDGLYGNILTPIGHAVDESGRVFVDYWNSILATVSGERLGYRGYLSQTFNALDGGLGLDEYYHQLFATAATFGTYDQIMAGVNWYFGLISQEQALQAIGSVGFFQAIGAVRVPSRVTPIPRNIGSSPGAGAINTGTSLNASSRVPGIARSTVNIATEASIPRLPPPGVSHMPGSQLPSVITLKSALRNIKNILDALPGKKGKTGPIKEVPSLKALDDLFAELSNGGRNINPGNYPGVVVELPDGTIIRRRPASKSGGATLDITLPDGTLYKVHIKI